MAKQRSTYGKFQRERDKQAKAAAKRERRFSKGERDEGDTESEATPSAPVVDQSAILDALAALYAEYEAGRIETDEFETRRDELRSQIAVD